MNDLERKPIIEYSDDDSDDDNNKIIIDKKNNKEINENNNKEQDIEEDKEENEEEDEDENDDEEESDSESVNNNNDGEEIKRKKKIKSIHGVNPRNLIEKITRIKIQSNPYWKEKCIGLNEESLVDRAMALDSYGGCFGGNKQPTHFLCLLLKMLQIQPEMDIIEEFIKNEDFKYVRILGAFYLRLIGKPIEIYNLLDPLYQDFRALRRKTDLGNTKVYLDQFIEELLTTNYSCDIALPHMPSRSLLIQQGLLKERKSPLIDMGLIDLNQIEKEQYQLILQERSKQQPTSINQENAKESEKEKEKEKGKEKSSSSSSSSKNKDRDRKDDRKDDSRDDRRDDRKDDRIRDGGRGRYTNDRDRRDYRDDRDRRDYRMDDRDSRDYRMDDRDSRGYRRDYRDNRDYRRDDRERRNDRDLNSTSSSSSSSSSSHNSKYKRDRSPASDSEEEGSYHSSKKDSSSKKKKDISKYEKQPSQSNNISSGNNNNVIDEKDEIAQMNAVRAKLGLKPLK